MAKLEVAKLTAEPITGLAAIFERTDGPRHSFIRAEFGLLSPIFLSSMNVYIPDSFGKNKRYKKAVLPAVSRGRIRLHGVCWFIPLLHDDGDGIWENGILDVLLCHPSSFAPGMAVLFLHLTDRSWRRL